MLVFLIFSPRAELVKIIADSMCILDYRKLSRRKINLICHILGGNLKVYSKCGILPKMLFQTLSQLKDLGLTVKFQIIH